MIRRVHRASEEWPSALMRENCGSVEPPHQLFLAGKDIPPESQCLGIVGTRRPTGAGREIAAELARRFVEAGFAIVSGLAIGIDAVAHAAALSSVGHTIAVLGCGVDRIYPKENAGLRNKIETAGTLVSEYPPGTDSRPFHFPARNRIIAALCSGVVVVEGGERSGALITARYALDANRSVWAVPGSTRNPMASGPNQLIRESQAALVTSADHVFEEIAPSLVWSEPPVEGAPPVTSGEKAILFEIDDAPTPLGRVVSSLGQSTGELALSLARLEARGLVIKRRGGYELTSAGVRVRSKL